MSLIPSVYTQITQSLTSSICSGHFLNGKPLTSPPSPGPEAILRVYEHIENGMAAKFFADDWKQPSTTWVGKMFDWLCGAGEYAVSSTEITSQLAKRHLIHDCEPLSSNEVICLPTATGAKTNSHAVNKTVKCPFIDPLFYNVHISLNSSDFATLVPKIQPCLQKWIEECQYNCLFFCRFPDDWPNLGANTSTFQFTSHDFPHRTWNIQIAAPMNIERYFKDPIEYLTKLRIERCEREIKNQFSTILTFSIIGSIVATIGGLTILGICSSKSCEYKLNRKVSLLCCPSQDLSEAPLLPKEKLSDSNDLKIIKSELNEDSYESLPLDESLPLERIKLEDSENDE